MILYKYVSPDRIDILKNKKIRFTQYFNQNDPYECSIAMLPLDREKQMAIDDDYLSERIEVQVKFENRFSQFGMLCLTKDPKNLLMWSHYADNHKGIVLGFNTDDPFFNTTEFQYDFVYRMKDEMKLAGFGSLKKIKYLKNRKKSKIGGKVNIYDILFTKSYHWKYEEEYRIYKNILNTEPPKELPNGEKLHLLDIPKNCFSEVIFGLNSDESLRKEVIQILNEEFDSKIALMRAKLRHLDFDIEFENIKYHP